MTITVQSKDGRETEYKIAYLRAEARTMLRTDGRKARLDWHGLIVNSVGNLVLSVRGITADGTMVTLSEVL